MMVATTKGQFNDVKGTVTFDGTDLTSAVLDVEILVDSIDTRNEQRDAHLKSPDFFDAVNFPTISFKSKKIVRGADNEFTIIGDLTIRGITREVSLAAESNGSLLDPWGMQRAGFSASTKINRLDYGLNWNAALETGGFVVAAEVKISLEIEIVRPAN